MTLKKTPLPTDLSPEAQRRRVEAPAGAKAGLPPEGDNVQPEAGVKPGLPTEAAAKAGKKLLIVEDERPLAHALEMKFRNQGYETKVVMNGVEALAALKAGGFGIILLDLIMPVMDGFAVLEELKNQKNKIPVIVLSNLGQNEDRIKAKELGAIEYFVKSNTPIAEIVNRAKSIL